MSFPKIKLWTCAVLLLLVGCAQSYGQEPVELIHLWERSPELEGKWLKDPEPPNVDLDVQRLDAPLMMDRVKEAQRATLIAKYPELSDEVRREALAAVMKNVTADPGNQQALLVFISAAIALSTDGSQAQTLWAAVQQDPTARLKVERALAKWQSPLALERWRARVADDTEGLEALMIAIEGLGTVGSDADAAALIDVIRRNESNLPTKIVAARSLGGLQQAQLEDFAGELLTSDLPQRELLAAYLLRGHSSAAAQRQMLEILALNNRPAQVIAYRVIRDLDLPTARDLATKLVRDTDTDNTLRLDAVRVLSQFDDEDSLRKQAYAVRDTDARVRREVRDNLFRKASAGKYRDFVEEAVAYYLAGDYPEATEQAIVLSVLLKLEDRCPQLVALLEHPQPRVFVRAAWGLQELAHDPKVLAGIQERAEMLAAKMDANESVPNESIVQAAFLFEALGRNRYQPAADMLKLYIPKDGQRMISLTRTAAIWALGQIYAGSQDAELADLLAARLLDSSSQDPEEDTVRYASSIALGLIGHPSSPEQLSRAGYSKPYPIAYSVEWAEQQFK